MAKNTQCQSVHQRVVLINRVKPGFSADVRQTQTVAVKADSADNTRCNAGGVGVAKRPEAQRVHHGNRPGTHRDDVANDSANAGGCALERLNEAGVIVAFNFERHGPAFADIDNASVLAHAHHEVFAHGVVNLLTKLAKVDLRGLIRAVFAPHHRIHGELTGGWSAAKQ